MRRRESGRYAPGTEFDPNAPWNRIEADEEPCECGNPKPEGAYECCACEEDRYCADF